MRGRKSWAHFTYLPLILLWKTIIKRGVLLFHGGGGWEEGEGDTVYKSWLAFSCQKSWAHNFHGHKDTVQWPNTASVNGGVCLSGQMSASPGRLIAFIVRCTWLDNFPQRRKPWPFTLASPFRVRQTLFSSSSYWLTPKINKPATPGPLHLEWPISL